MSHFKNRVVWITGASEGIGKETAIQLSRLGAKLALSARTVDKLNHVKSELAHPENCLVVPLDLAKPEQFPDAVNSVYQKFGKVDVLFNNAGISQRSYIVDTDISVDRKIMEVNYFGTVALTKLVLPRMLKDGGGHFAVTSSIVGKFGFGVRSAYSASKHALHGFFESLYVELRKEGIGITIICPGAVQTNISKNALDGAGKPTGEMDEMQLKGIPVEKCVKIILNGIERKKREIIIGDAKVKLGAFLKAFAPGILFKMASKQNPRGELKI